MSSTRGKRSLSRSQQHQVTIDSDEEDDHQSSRPTSSSHSNKENRSSNFSSSGSSNMNTVTTHHSLTSHFVPELKVQQSAHVVLKDKEIHRFEGLSIDAQNLCVKTVVRFFLMKGLNVMMMMMMMMTMVVMMIMIMIYNLEYQ